MSKYNNIHKSTFFPDSCFSWFLGKILFLSFLYKILVWKNRSWLSGKIHVDRILAGEARIASPGKNLVFLTSCLILFFLGILVGFFFSWNSGMILLFLDSCLNLVLAVLVWFLWYKWSFFIDLYNCPISLLVYFHNKLQINSQKNKRQGAKIIYIKFHITYIKNRE